MFIWIKYFSFIFIFLFSSCAVHSDIRKKTISFLGCQWELPESYFVGENIYHVAGVN